MASTPTGPIQPNTLSQGGIWFYSGGGRPLRAVPQNNNGNGKDSEH